GEPRETQSCIVQALTVVVVDLVAVSVALVDLRFAVRRGRQRTVGEQDALRTEPHRAPEVGVFVTLLDLTIAGLPLRDECDNRVRRIRVEFGAARALEAGDVARELDDSNLQPQADAEVGDAVLARVAHGQDLALGATIAETTRHYDAVHAAQAI